MHALAQDPTLVREFRQILLWPLQLMPAADKALAGEPWRLLETTQGHPWARLADEFTDDAAQFQERHYHELTTFLPYVQRLLYGEGKADTPAASESPIRVYRRTDIAQVRLHYPAAGAALAETPPTQLLRVVHLDLYFFQGLDVAILVLELAAADLPLALVQETLYRLGRAYPTQWREDGRAEHCMAGVEWLGADGSVAARSDYDQRELYLQQVCRQRAPRVAAHWEFLLRPLVPHYSDAQGAVRYRLVDHHRMPLMAYLAVRDPYALTRADCVRLAWVTAPGPADCLPFPERELVDFETRCCSDRYWHAPGADATAARYLCTGAAFVLLGRSDDAHFVDAERGLLAQFRHQDFLLFLLAHLQKAALFMMSDRLVDAINHLKVADPQSVRAFKRRIRELKRTLLGFTHGYWFQQVSAQTQARELYRLCQQWLDSERLYSEVRQEVEDMNDYLDSDSLRRQANTVVRLTVVTMFGLIGTISTGFLGMNLLAEADSPLWQRLALFFAVFLPTLWLTLYTIIKSQRLSDFLDALANENLPARTKFGALLEVWRKRAD